MSQHSFKPKPSPEQAPSSLQFSEGWENWRGSAEGKVRAGRGWFLRIKEGGCLHSIKVQVKAALAAGYPEDLAEMAREGGALNNRFSV